MTKITVLNYDFDVSVSSKMEDWLVVKDERYRPDRPKFVLDTFNKAYPHIKVTNAEQVYKLASRSTKVNEWLARVNSAYALLQNEPTFYRDYVPTKDYEIVMRDIQNNSEVNKNKAKAQQLAAERYQKEMEDIERQYSSYQFSSKYSKVVNLDSTKLPLTLQLAIENYTPAGKDTAEKAVNKRSYAREVLISYKLELIKLIKNKPDVDIDIIIESAQEK